MNNQANNSQKNSYERLIISKTTFLFDMDGTILNSEPLHEKAIIQTLEKLNIDQSLIESECFIGKSDFDVYSFIKQLVPDLAVSANHFIHQKSELLKTIISTISQIEFDKLVTPGFFEFLNYLHSHKKQVAIVSASESEIVKHTLEKLKITQFLNFYISRNDTYFAKPNPSLYLQALRKLGSTSQETVIFEDSLPGMMAAEQTGSIVFRIKIFSDMNFPNKFSQKETIDNFYGIFYQKKSHS